MILQVGHVNLYAMKEEIFKRFGGTDSLTLNNFPNLNRENTILVFLFCKQVSRIANFC